MNRAAAARPQAVIHVDLDGSSHIYAHHGWPYPYTDDPIFESGMQNLLDFLAEHELRATLFAIASDLDDPVKKEWLQRAVAAGHEIASHSLTHPELDDLDLAARRRELGESRIRLSEELDTQVVGFRAPSYQIDRDTFEMLAETGYEWDSSVFPNSRFASRLATPSILPVPHRPLLDNAVLELPLPDYSPAPFPFHPSYSLLLGNAYFEFCFRRFARRGDPMVLLLHLADFADPMPAARLTGLKSKIFTASQRSASQKRAHCDRVIRRIGEQFDFCETRELVAAYRDARTARKLVLGISTTHETGAAIIDGHQTLAAVSEERLDRIKFSTKYPPKLSIDAVIETAGVDPKDITDVAIGGLPASRLGWRMLVGQIKDSLEFHGWNDYFPHLNRVLYRLFAFSRSIGYRRVLGYLKQRYGIEPRLHFVPHHLCHAASAYRTAPFQDALIVTADGVGDDISITVSTGIGGRIRLLKMIPYPHSFGQFYTACTQILGFSANRHEGKITGLSGYGKIPQDLYDKVKSTIKTSGPNFRLDKRFYSEGFIRGFDLGAIRRGEDLFDSLQYRNYKQPLAELVAGYSREDVAAVFQLLLEEELAKLVRPFAEEAGLRNLCLAGGIFANVKVNAYLFRTLGFENVYIYPAMGDSGLGPGAALELLQAKPAPFDDVYLGPGYDDAAVERALIAAAPEGLRYERPPNLERRVAELLADMNVIARFNGRMEFGPRALGNRTILYYTKEREANTWLNNRLGRTEFMPFAPIVMREHAEMLFKGIEGTEHACKFMTLILECTDWTRENCPAIVHVDHTARPQFVTREINPSMHAILSYFYEMTGHPILVNTSFNMHEEPIVCTPEDAVRAYLSSRLDYLAAGPFLCWIEGSEGSHGEAYAHGHLAEEVGSG